MREKICQFCSRIFVPTNSNQRYCNKRENLEKKRERQRKWKTPNPGKARESHRKCAKKWAAANPEKVRERNRRYRDANRETLRERDRCRRAANPEKFRERSREQYAANPQKRMGSTRKWRAANPEKWREYCRKWDATNRDPAKSREATRRYEASKKPLTAFDIIRLTERLKNVRSASDDQTPDPR